MTLCQKTFTKKDIARNKIEEGWYTKDDMIKVLRWNVNLCGMNHNIVGL